jgi:LPS-assembly protein
MKNKIIFSFIICLLLQSLTYLQANDEFNFNMTEIEITNEGNFFKGLKRGTVKTNNEQTIIAADTFEYDKNKNILNAKGNVEIIDKIKNYVIQSSDIVYFKNTEEIISKGVTEVLIETKYKILSSDISINRISNTLRSIKKTIIIDDNFNRYEIDTIDYSIDKSILKAKNINITTNINSINNNEKEFYFFKDGIFNLEKKNFIASETKIKIKKNIFNENENDPRIHGVTSKKNGNITKISKAIFTSCKLTDSCSPWSIQSEEIIHDVEKKDIIYKNPILRIYDYPVFYYPKFSHPDPTVNRRSGLLQPQLNNSNILGSSLYLPYFHVLSENKDITYKPTIFDGGIYMFQSEYRQKNENSNMIANFGLTKGYKASNDSKNSIINFFAKFNSKLNLSNFINSDLDISIQKITKDTFLKVFDTNLIDLNKNIKPTDQNKLKSEMKLFLEHENFNFNSGFIAYENLNGLNSDRYQYVFPYYNFSNNFYESNLFNLNFLSSGYTNLKDTNKIESSINNDLNFESVNFFSKLGFKNSLDIYFKNLNTVGKNVNNFKSSPQIDLMNIINYETALPLIKLTDKFTNILTPKLSFRINPGDMNNASSEDRKLNVNNIFDINRLNLSETFEGGKSLTLGLDYKKQSINDINRYFEFKLAGVLRDLNQENIPINSSIGQKTSNLFGGAKYNLSENFNIDYDFAIDNDFNTFEQNTLNLNFQFNKFSSNFTYSENNGKMGETNIFGNSTTINFNNDNSLTFATRRNRKINFTEYYDLVYEYKNDCLVAGIKYKKSYYEDRDLKPKEDLLFTITIFPLSQYEQKIDESIYRGN